MGDRGRREFGPVAQDPMQVQRIPCTGTRCIQKELRTILHLEPFHIRRNDLLFADLDQKEGRVRQIASQGVQCDQEDGELTRLGIGMTGLERFHHWTAIPEIPEPSIA